jgi:RNA polymerase sigma factor (sigma-70 family)
MLGDKAEAADMTQDVFIKLWEHEMKMDPDRVLGWLLKVARNGCIDLIRKRKVRKAVKESQEFSLDSISSDEILPDRIASNVLFDEKLKRALDTMGEPHKSIVVLREVQDYKYEEISELLNLPLNTVKVYLHRARKMLRIALGNEMMEGSHHDFV